MQNLDPLLYNLQMIRAPDAWALGYGGSADVPICVLDTGVDVPHPALNAQLWVNGAEMNGTAGVDDDIDGVVDDIYGARYLSGVASGNVTDGNGHGTHCSGIVAGFGPTSAATTLAGVAPFTRLITARGLRDTGSGTLSDLVAGMKYCAARGARVISNSWASCNSEPPGGYMQTTFNSFPNVTFVFAAGNNALNIDSNTTCGYPGTVPADNVINVGAVDYLYDKTSYSNYGTSKVDVMAPGDNVLSTYPGGRFVMMSGTSMACPHVAGMAGVLLAKNATLTPLQIKNAIIGSCFQVGNSSTWSACGGIVDLYSAVELV